MTEALSCSSDLSPSQQSSSSGDLLPEMMESDTPPSAALPDEVGELEVSTRRASLSPEGPKSSTPTRVRPGELKSLLERASISEDHRALMRMVIGRISSAERGLHNAAMSLLAGFEVRENDAPPFFDSFAHKSAPCIDSSP